MADEPEQDTDTKVRRRPKDLEAVLIDRLVEVLEEAKDDEARERVVAYIHRRYVVDPSGMEPA